MASMIFASSPLSVQSFVKLRTNSNYSHSPCYVSRAKNSYIHLPYKNILNIQSLFTKGGGNFSFSSTKFPRVASKYSPSLNIIKAISEGENVYHLDAHDVKTGKPIQLGDNYGGKILLIVNLPQEFSSKVEDELKFLNELRKEYKDKTSRGFEILGLFPYMKDAEEKIKERAEFPIFRKGKTHDEFEKYLVDETGKCIKIFPWFEGETLKGSEKPTPGGNPFGKSGLEENPPDNLEGKTPKDSEKPKGDSKEGETMRPEFGENPFYTVENAIIKLLQKGDNIKD